MSPKLRIAYFAHSVRSDWNNGNAHFLRGLLRALGALGHSVMLFEPCNEWSVRNLRSEELGEWALQQFSSTYPDLIPTLYSSQSILDRAYWHQALKEFDIVILHEWNPPALAHTLLEIRAGAGFKLLFHDTHHRASSSPQQIYTFATDRFDGVLAFGEVLRSIYNERFGIKKVWTLHEAADTTIFHPISDAVKKQEVVWIGNWGDEERSNEIYEFILQPATALSNLRFTIFGVRYPEQALAQLDQSGVRYGGYLPNLQAPAVYAASSITLHVPRREYADRMPGIPTIRVFEALACGIPLISAPWTDSERLFRKGDLLFVTNQEEMRYAIERLLAFPKEAAAQAQRGLETILTRHTCRHRAEQLSSICEEILC
jgi:spore maturation protein CgeB